MKILLIAFGLFCASCNSASPPDPEEPVFIEPLQTEIIEVETEQVIPTALPAPTPTEFVPEPQRSNWLLLGLDHRKHRTGTEEGNHTDVIVLVSILETDPIEITVIQFPRNLWVPIERQEDQWLFSVYGNEGWQGVHHWFNRALGIALQGIFVIDMDQWVFLVDDLGGLKVITVSGEIEMAGDETLLYLRDNDNNWNFGSYDKEERVFRMLEAFWTRGLEYITDDPISAGKLVLERWGDLYESDLSNPRQIYWVFDLGLRLKTLSTKVTFLQLEEPMIERGDTPLSVRGMIPATDLKIWTECVMSNQENCGP